MLLLMYIVQDFSITQILRGQLQGTLKFPLMNCRRDLISDTMDFSMKHILNPKRLRIL